MNASETPSTAPLPVRTFGLAGLRAAERQRQRRLFWTSLAALALTALPLWSLPPPDRLADADRARRFGYFGPTRLVPEIDLPAEDDARVQLSIEPGLSSAFALPRAGGEGERGSSPDAPGRAPGPPLEGLSSPSARSLLRASLPTVRSEELVIEVLVKPEYPRTAQEAGLEAVVELEAFVDIDGRVRETHVLSNSGDAQFASASERAVMRCRFRPFRQNGTATPVLAIFRFNFKLI